VISAEDMRTFRCVAKTKVQCNCFKNEALIAMIMLVKVIKKLVSALRCKMIGKASFIKIEDYYSYMRVKKFCIVLNSIKLHLKLWESN